MNARLSVAGLCLLITVVLLAQPAAADAGERTGPRPWPVADVMGAEQARWQIAASANREVKIGASIVLQTIETESTCGNCGPGGTPRQIRRCNYTIFVQFPNVSGAKSYNVVVEDKVTTTRSFTGPPFHDGEGGHKTPGGSHWFGLTNGAGPAGSCPTETGEGKRFVIKKAVAIFDSTSRIVGSVRKPDGTGVAGVRVSASGPGGKSVKTDANGGYGMKVNKGRHEVSAKGYCVAGVAGCKSSKSVSVGDGPQLVDFREEVALAVTGTIRDEFGRGLPDVRTTLTGPDNASASTDSSGRYRLDVEQPGTYELTATGSGRGPDERYYILSGGSATEGTAADVTFAADQADPVQVDWELDRRLQFDLTTRGEARADGASKVFATLRALTQHGDPAPGVELIVDPPTNATPRAVICSTDSDPRPLWPSLDAEGQVSPAGLPLADSVTDARGEVPFRVFPGTQAGSFNIRGNRRTDDQRAFSAISESIQFEKANSRPIVNTDTLEAALFRGGAGFGMSGDVEGLFEALAGRQANPGDGLSGIDGAPLRTLDSGRRGVVLFSRDATPDPGPGKQRLLGPDDGGFVLRYDLTEQITGDAKLVPLREWLAGEYAAVEGEGRTYLGWPTPTVANGGVGTCLENSIPGENFQYTLYSPVRLLLTDGQGRRLGIDAKGKTYTEAPGAVWRNGETAYVSAPVGNYTVSLVGTGSGPVKLEYRRGGVTSLAQFSARKGATSRFKAGAGGALPKSFKFAGTTVRPLAGVPLVVKGLPKRLRPGAKPRLKLRVTDAFGDAVPGAALSTTGAAGALVRFADARGRINVNLPAVRRGTVRFTVAAPGLLPLKAQAKVSP